MPASIRIQRARPGRIAGSFLLGLVPFALLAGFAVRLAGRATDDMYITYRYAQNLAAGRGLVFNPGERVFGITDPGVAILLAGAHRATGLSIPVLGTWLHALSIALIVGLLVAEARGHGRRPEAIAAGILIATSSVLWAAQGSGPPVALALLLLAASWQAKYPARAGAMAGLAVICRPDALVGVAILGLMGWLGKDSVADLKDGKDTKDGKSERRAPPWVYGLAAAGVVALGAFAARSWFGTLIPNTLAAKQAYAALDPERWQSGLAFWNRGFELLAASAGPLALGIVGLGLVGLWFLARNAGRPGLLLALYGLTLSAIYPLLGVPFFVWYAAPPLIALLAAAPFAIGAAVRRIPWAGLRFAVLVLLACPLIGSIVGGFRAIQNPGAGDWRFPAYSQAGAWIATHSIPDEDIAYEEIGILAFTSDRPVQDLVGLVTPRSLPYAQDRLGAFLAKPTTFVIFHTYNARGGTRPIVDRPWFPKAYREVARFTSNLPGETGRYLAIYRRIDGAPVPPPRPPRKRISGEGA
ncbi:MAG: hypothetical protein ABJC13_16740 [Acidobacteriota bacterium]